MEKKRRAELSFMNVLFCIFVIFIHIISYPVSELPMGNLKYNIVLFPWRAVSFVVQGFVFLAGVKLFLNGKDSMPYGKYLAKRLPAILVPYIIAFAAYFLFYFFVYDYPFDILFILRHFLMGSLVSHLYFVPIILQFDLLLPLWRRIIDRCSPIFVIPFVLLFSLVFESYLPNMISTLFPNVNFIYNDRFFTTYLAFWIMGCYVGRNYEDFCALVKKNFSAICVMFGISSAICAIYSYFAFNGVAYIPQMSYLHSIYVVCAIVFVFAVALKCSDAFEKIPAFSAIDEASYYIYLWHMLILFFANYILKLFGISAQAPAFIIRAVITYGVTLLLCVAYVKIKKKTKSKRAA